MQVQGEDKPYDDINITPMLDLAMLRTLLDAVPDEATLILVGDADQLTSVATGSVLMDVVGALEAGDEGIGELLIEHPAR